jgi:hypothetical protein
MLIVGIATKPKTEKNGAWIFLIVLGLLLILGGVGLIIWGAVVNRNNNNNNNSTCKSPTGPDNIPKNPVGVPITGAAGQNFGTTVALSNNGLVAFVSAISAPTPLIDVYSRTCQQSPWSLISTISGPSGESWGSTIDCSGDGSVLVVGSPLFPIATNQTGKVHIYRRSNNTWTPEMSFASDAAVGVSSSYGNSVSIDSAGAIIAVGDANYNSNHGRTQILRFSAGSWTRGQNLAGSDQNGTPLEGFFVKLSRNGTILVATGPEDTSLGPGLGFRGAVWTYQNTGGVFSQLGVKLQNPDTVGAAKFGFTVALNDTGNIMSVGSNTTDGANYASVIVFGRVSTTWNKIQTLTVIPGLGDPVAAGYGTSLWSNGTGNVLAVGAPGFNSNQGTVGLYNLVAGMLTYNTSINPTTTGGSFGALGSLRINSNSNAAIVGAGQQNTGAGAVYNFAA